MHNTPLANAEFAVQFTTTNLRYLLGAEPPDAEAIARCRAQLAEAEALAASLKSTTTQNQTP